MPIRYSMHRPPRWLGGLLAIPLLILAAVFGLVVLAVVLGLVVVAAVVVGVHWWRLKRRLRRAQAAQILEGEYVTVRESRRDRLAP